MTDSTRAGNEGYETVAFELNRSGVRVIRTTRLEVLTAIMFPVPTELARVWKDEAADARNNLAVATPDQD